MVTIVLWSAGKFGHVVVFDRLGAVAPDAYLSAKTLVSDHPRSSGDPKLANSGTYDHVTGLIQIFEISYSYLRRKVSLVMFQPEH